MRHIPDPNRGTGRTTVQLRQAPQGAVFVAAHRNAVDYTKHLARHIERDDLQIISPTLVENGGDWFRGLILTGLILDHAFWGHRRSTPELERGLEIARSRVR